MFRQKFFISEPVLHAQESGSLMKERRNKFEQIAIRCSLHGDQDEVAGADVRSRSIRIYFGQTNIFSGSVNVNSLLLDGRKTAPNKKMNIASTGRQLATIIEANRAGADNRDPELLRHCQCPIC